MQLASVLLARYYALVQIEDLNLAGTVFYPELVSGLVERYEFQKYPTQPGDFDETKGIEFASGRWGETAIDKVVILNSGIYLDTSTNTDTSERLLLEALDWAVKNFRITFRREMIKRCVYLSQVTFYSGVPILALNPVLTKISNTITKEVTKSFGQQLEYENAAISMSYDQLATRLGTAAFTVQRREGVPFAENKYFSTAPVKTEIHLQLLEQLERECTR